MSIANTFPVFEPDQVLTNKHLNDMFNYLDEQDRLTRCKLLGSGIICGLDISHTAASIAITKGCGLTTQGYIIMLCDHTGDNAYKYYMPYSRPPFPKDLQLISQCSDPDTTNILFYGETFNANNINNQFLLLTQKDADALSDKTDVNPITKLGLDDYAVVLFLEATETSLKNCDTNDCNDKGNLMDFEVKPLFIYKPLLQGNKGTKSNFQPIDLRRYNVPAQTLKTSEDVLNAFVTIVEALPLKRLAADLEDSFTNYKSLLTGINTNPFGSEADFKNMLAYVMKNFPYLVQYFYDFIYDLTRSLYEFRYRLHDMTSACCGDEMLFPFHLTLGEASVNTPVNGTSAYRQYFIYSPLFDAHGGNRGEISSLLMRMILMYQDCFFTKRILGKNNKLTLTNSLRVTPSTYGRNFISERCIPYYYSAIAEKGDAIPADLYYYWNYDKTRRGNAAYNLSYNAYDYNKADSVVFPLYYDIEWYDFFRIEGFIGNNINTVLTQLKTQQQNFNLPFDIAALSADYIGALVKGEEPKCSIQDLESDYRVLIAGFVCRLHDPFCDAANKDFANFSRLTNGLFAVNTEIAEAKTTAETAGNLARNRATIVTDHPFISGLVNEFQALGSYVKGAMLQRLCQPASGTMGRYYIDSLAKNGGKFVNPFKNTADSLDYQLMQFIDSVETMFKMLMDNSLDTLDTGYFKGAYLGFEINGIAYFDLLMRDLRANTDNEANREEIFEAESDEKIMLNTCITEKLDALKTEYNRRMAQYRLAKNFAYYFKQHGGVEHKAGVPRGGTFILVYHEERGNRRADAGSLLVNSDMGKLLLSEYRDLLNPDTGLDTLEAKTKMLAVTTLYKDPTLYLKFKDVMQQYLDACDDLPADKRTAITGILNQPPPAQTFDLTDGMVIADFYVPYMCCSDCPPVAYILPVNPAPPTPLTVTQGDPVCDSTNRFFTVIVTAAGGTAPYSFSVNNTAQTSGIVQLPSGGPDATVTVKDAAGQTATITIKSHSCDVQSPLGVTQGDPQCSALKPEFSVALTVTGGTAPYTYNFNGKTQSDNNIVLTSGSPDTTVTITDAAGQTITTTIKSHTCPGQDQCNLPCSGLAENCKYALWMSRPVDAKDFVKHVIDKANLNLTDEAGVITNIDATAAFKFALDAKDKITNAADFDKAITELAKRLTDLVPAKFMSGGDAMFSYEPVSQTIVIERFTCQGVVLDFGGTLAMQGQNFDYHALYDTQGPVTIKLGIIESPFIVPKFDCVSMDKCKATSKPVCSKKPSIKNINVEQLPANGSFIFSIASADSFDTWFWYFHDGRPMYATGEKPQVTFVETVKTTFVRVIAINSQTGCFDMMEQTVTIRQ